MKICLSSTSDLQRVEIATALLSDVIRDVVAGAQVFSLPVMIPAPAEAWGEAR